MLTHVPVILAMIAGSNIFDKLVATFIKAYADQGEHDYCAFHNAIRQGRIEIDPD